MVRPQKEVHKEQKLALLSDALAQQRRQPWSPLQRQQPPLQQLPPSRDVAALQPRKFRGAVVARQPYQWKQDKWSTTVAPRRPPREAAGDVRSLAASQQREPRPPLPAAAVAAPRRRDSTLHAPIVMPCARHTHVVCPVVGMQHHQQRMIPQLRMRTMTCPSCVHPAYQRPPPPQRWRHLRWRRAPIVAMTQTPSGPRREHRRQPPCARLPLLLYH